MKDGEVNAGVFGDACGAIQRDALATEGKRDALQFRQDFQDFQD